MEENARAAVARAGVDCDIEKITDIKTIMGFGIMVTPALVLDGKVKASGKVLSVDEIIAFL
jgi:small redox-active disulfide protein 2